MLIICFYFVFLKIIGGTYMEKHYFAGNNTSVGFYNYFDNIISPEEADRIYILKGGPGVGKSSFMKKFAKFFSKMDIYIEYIHCSTDYNSLDGVFIPEYKLLMVDGTPPHVVEPKFPGLVDEILDFGKYLDIELLEEHASQIKKISKEKSRFYKSGYRYLKMAGIILSETGQIYDDLADDNKENLETKKLIIDLKKLLSKGKEANGLEGHSKGKFRRFFLEAYTANGYISYINNLCDNKVIWEIISPNYNHIADLLDKIVNLLRFLDYDVEAYYMAIFPEKLQHIYIKGLNLMIISSEAGSYKDKFKRDCNTVEKTIKAERTYNIYQLRDEAQLTFYQAEIGELNKLYDLFLKKAINSFIIAKKNHELLEKIYIRSMNFDKVDLLYNDIISKLKREIKAHKEE